MAERERERTKRLKIITLKMVLKWLMQLKYTLQKPYTSYD